MHTLLKKIMITLYLLIFISISNSQTNNAIFYHGDQVNTLGKIQNLKKRNFDAVIVHPYFNKTSLNFLYKEFSVIAAMDGLFDLRKGNPFGDASARTDYNNRLNSIASFISTYGNKIVGVYSDFEIAPFPRRVEYDTAGGNPIYPSNSEEPEYQDMIYGTYVPFANNGLERENFAEFINYTGVDLTLDMIMYNDPQESIVQDSIINKSLYLGYYLQPQFEGVYHGYAQTFTPLESKISKIDVKIKRFGSESGIIFPYGNIRYYLTTVHSNGYPNLNDKITKPRFINKKQINRNGSTVSTDFNNIDEISLYINPDEYGELSSSQKIAIVLEYYYTNYDNPIDSYYKIAATSSGTDGPYEGGEVYRIQLPNPSGTMAKYPNQDLWFKVYYPNPNKNVNLHEKWIDFQCKHLEVMAAEFKSKIGSKDLYVYSGYSGLEIWGDNWESNIDRYSTNWTYLKNYVDYPICGYGIIDPTQTISDLGGSSKPLIAGAKNKNDFLTLAGDSRFSSVMYYYDGSSMDNDQWYLESISTNQRSIENQEAAVNDYNLSDNYPNPFNPSTKISYSIPSEELVNITVYNMLGEKITTLVEDYMKPGTYTIRFDASELPSGIYVYTLKTQSFSESKKMILIK